MSKQELKSTECRLLTEKEIEQRIKKTSKIDVDSLIKRGYVEAKEFHRRLENGNL